MRLNLPILESLQNCKNLLIDGIGGGFDIFCGLPFYFELKQHGINIHLANYSFSAVEALKDGIRLSETLVGVTAETEYRSHYFPEVLLSHWLQQTQHQDTTIWCFAKTGVKTLERNYKLLIDHLSIDGILCVDGGVDSLLIGNEPQVGTWLEDTISLCAVHAFDKIPRWLACVGYGAEEDISYSHVVENIAKLSQEDAFLGSCSLVKQMEAYQAYEKAVLYTQSQHESSVINSSIISAVQGNFGDYHMTDKTSGSTLKISPLMPIYWFFDFEGVAKRNLLVEDVEFQWTRKYQEAWQYALDFRQRIPRRKALTSSL
jgi:hypothetical protein